MVVAAEASMYLLQALEFACDHLENGPDYKKIVIVRTKNYAISIKDLIYLEKFESFLKNHKIFAGKGIDFITIDKNY